jgi:FkbM family methyltransferase
VSARLFRVLHALGRAVPGGFPHATAFGNRVLRPLFERAGDAERHRVTVWDGLSFEVDPRDTIGGNLAFAPRAFEFEERRFLARHLGPGGCFVDVGANIGIFTLFAARIVGPGGRVVAIEPDALSHAALLSHLEMNGLRGAVTVLALGVSSRQETLRVISANPTNRGATTLEATGAGPAVRCVPLAEALRLGGCEAVDVLKIDIEGRELEVLEVFFADSARGIAARPRALVVETEGGPGGADHARALDALISGAGYRLDRASLNSFYVRE